MFSENAVTFAATPVGGISEATIHITNPSLARLDSAVIRGAAPEQGLRAFEFQVPDGMPFSLSPHVGVVKPGKVSHTLQRMLDTHCILAECEYKGLF